ncbi:HSP20 family protein [Lactobacillus colini]|uniref:HSP20 family protein n=1 Tax=Lactobacillus colini TaxID=1819254 RepID=A0ABS4MCG1_9LACO|nr:Hsp20/alpha crystallin family protein [Lactobacillus colini]MBP2057372.1 HSP20 family protein [Lactobacillus colini]
MANEMMNRNSDMLDRLNDWFGFPKDFFDEGNVKNIMQSDVAETDKDYIVKVDMPGMDKKDIKVTYKNSVLTISGSRTSFNKENDDNGNLLHQERSVGHIQRSYRIPDINAKEISAKDENGVLTVTLPKLSEQEEENSITIE